MLIFIICTTFFMGVPEGVEGGGVYKFNNLILTNFLSIWGNLEHFEFYKLCQQILEGPFFGWGWVEVGDVQISKSHFDKFSRHFRKFGTFLIFMIWHNFFFFFWGGGRGWCTNFKISFWQILSPFPEIWNNYWPTFILSHIFISEASVNLVILFLVYFYRL